MKLIWGIAVLCLAASGQGRRGGFVPGQQRPSGDPAEIARGKTVYGVSCQGCHGADLRGGDMGGPNLLRSQVALSDQKGENIVPIIQGSRQGAGMPKIDIPAADASAVAAYIRSMLETIGRQGMPPRAGVEAGNIVVGNAAEGRAYFQTKCSSCHSITGDLRGIGSRYGDAKMLQNAWVAGRGGRESRSVRIALPGGMVEGRLVRIDDFLVTVELADGTERTIRRDGDVPKVVVNDPQKAHRDLLPTYTDKAMHDVTAYLVTAK